MALGLLIDAGSINTVVTCCTVQWQLQQRAAPVPSESHRQLFPWAHVPTTSEPISRGSVRLVDKHSGPCWNTSASPPLISASEAPRVAPRFSKRETLHLVNHAQWHVSATAKLWRGQKGCSLNLWRELQEFDRPRPSFHQLHKTNVPKRALPCRLPRGYELEYRRKDNI